MKNRRLDSKTEETAHSKVTCNDMFNVQTQAITQCDALKHEEVKHSSVDG